MKKTIIEPHKSSLGMDANMTVLIMFIAMYGISYFPYIGYLALLAVPLVFFFIEKTSKFVKFQAVQAIVIGVLRAVTKLGFDIIYWAITPKSTTSVTSALTYLGGGWIFSVLIGFISWIVNILILLLIVYVVYMAYGYKQVELPVIASIATKASEKLDHVNINFNQPNNSQNYNQNHNNQNNPPPNDQNNQNK